MATPHGFGEQQSKYSKDNISLVGASSRGSHIAASQNHELRVVSKHGIVPCMLQRCRNTYVSQSTCRMHSTRIRQSPELQGMSIHPDCVVCSTKRDIHRGPRRSQTTYISMLTNLTGKRHFCAQFVVRDNVELLLQNGADPNGIAAVTSRTTASVSDR
jgi:hypothetical protein